jgi:pimeloyl-ACP methyl ester carboxylesterase
MFNENDEQEKMTMSPSNEITPTQPGKFIKANNLNIYYEEQGSGEPVVLLHGGLVSSARMRPFVPALSKHFRVITPDLRGHGKTNNPSGGFSYRLLADDVAEFIKRLELSEPLVCGWSDGGQTALELGMHYPNVAKALVVGAAWFKFSESYQNFLRFLGIEGPGRVNYEQTEKAVPPLVKMLRTTHEPGPDYWKDLLKQISVMWWEPLRYNANDFERIIIPTLILVGDRDPIVPVEEAAEMYRLIPKAELAIVPNGDHSFPSTNPDIFTTLSSGFLLRHCETRSAG